MVTRNGNILGQYKLKHILDTYSIVKFYSELLKTVKRTVRSHVDPTGLVYFVREIFFVIKDNSASFPSFLQNFIFLTGTITIKTYRLTLITPSPPASGCALSLKKIFHSYQASTVIVSLPLESEL